MEGLTSHQLKLIHLIFKNARIVFFLDRFPTDVQVKHIRLIFPCSIIYTSKSFWDSCIRNYVNMPVS